MSKSKISIKSKSPNPNGERFFAFYWDFLRNSELGTIIFGVMEKLGNMKSIDNLLKT